MPRAVALPPRCRAAPHGSVCPQPLRDVSNPAAPSHSGCCRRSGGLRRQLSVRAGCAGGRTVWCGTAAVKVSPGRAAFPLSPVTGSPRFHLCRLPPRVFGWPRGKAVRGGARQREELLYKRGRMSGRCGVPALGWDCSAQEGCSVRCGVRRFGLAAFQSHTMRLTWIPSFSYIEFFIRKTRVRND